MPTFVRLFAAALALAVLATVFMFPFLVRFHPAIAWGLIVALVGLACFALGWSHARRWVALAAALSAAVTVSGCAGFTRLITTPQADDTVGARILNDIQGCSRTYGGSLGPAGIQGSFNISCEPGATAVIPLKDFGKTPATPPQDPPA